MYLTDCTGECICFEIVRSMLRSNRIRVTLFLCHLFCVVKKIGGEKSNDNSKCTIFEQFKKMHAFIPRVSLSCKFDILENTEIYKICTLE